MATILSFIENDVNELNKQVSYLILFNTFGPYTGGGARGGGTGDLANKALEGIVHANDRAPDDGLGHIQLVRADLVSGDGVAALRAVARVDLDGRHGNLQQQFADFARRRICSD